MRRVEMKILGVVLLGAAVMSSNPSIAAGQSPDAQLRAIYTAEWKWREQQFPDQGDDKKPVADHLPKVDPATQEMRQHYYEGVLKRLDTVRRAQLSRDEQINYDVYRP